MKSVCMLVSVRNNKSNKMDPRSDLKVKFSVWFLPRNLPSFDLKSNAALASRLASQTLHTLSTSNHNCSNPHLLIWHTYWMISRRSNKHEASHLIRARILSGWADGDEWASNGEDGIRVPLNRVTCQWDRGDWCWSNMEESSEESPGASSHRGVRELGLLRLCPLGPLITFSDFSGHFVFVFCILLFSLRPLVEAVNLIEPLLRPAVESRRAKGACCASSMISVR